MLRVEILKRLGLFYLRMAVILLANIFVSCGFGLRLACLSADLSISDQMYQSCALPDQWHPILGVRPNEGLNARKLDRSTFLELNAYYPPSLAILWQRDFAKAEREAADQFCDIVKGMNKAQIELLAGKPAYRRRTNIENWKYIKLGDDIWLYEFGGNHVPVKLLFRSKICTSAQVFEWRGFFDESQLEDCGSAYDLPIHPILKSKAGKGLNGKKLHPSVFKKLKNLTEYEMASRWRRDFQKAESEAAEQFCLSTKGLSKRDVVALIGQPSVKGRNECWQKSQVDEEVWLYTLGGTEVPVRLFFKQNRCVRSEFYGGWNYHEFFKWRLTQIRGKCLGKTVAEVLKILGVPDRISDFAMDYPGATITFKDGRCLRVEEPGLIAK